MKKKFVTIEAGGEEFAACWDMTAWATFEKLSGHNSFEGFRINASNALDALWAGIEAAAAHYDKPVPVTRRRLGTLFTSIEEMNRAFGIVADLVSSFAPERKAEPEGKAGSAATLSPSHDAISSPESTLASASASSGD